MAKVKIKLLTQMMGSITADKGEIISVEEKEAKRHVDSGNGEYVNNIEEDGFIKKESIGNTSKGKKPRIEIRK